MNRGVLQNSPVQQMMAAGNPSLWNINNLIRPPFMSSTPPPSSITHFLAPPPNPTNHNPNHNNNLFQVHYNLNMSTTTSSNSWLDYPHPNYHHEQHQIPESLSQLLLGGVFSEEEAKKMESWEEQVVFQHQQHPCVVDAKKESSENSYNYANNNPNNSNVFSTHQDQEFQQLTAAKWSSQISIPASSPQSCVTTFSSSNTNNMLDFSSKSSDNINNLQSRHPIPTLDHSSECNSRVSGRVLKKAKVQASIQPTFKVRKEKLGDRVTTLHQLVSPFGKTDTASVLLEAIGYIRFLHNQIEALSLPYLSSGAGNKRQSHPVQGEKKCIFPEDPGQLLNENCLKRKGGPDQDSCNDQKDLRSRGLCLVPVSCTLNVGSDNGADYWAPAVGSGFR